MKVGVSNMGFWWWVLGELELWWKNGNKVEEGELMVFTGTLCFALCIFLIISGFCVPSFLFSSTSNRVVTLFFFFFISFFFILTVGYKKKIKTPLAIEKYNPYPIAG